MPFFDFHTHHSQRVDSLYNLKQKESPPEKIYFSAGIHPWNVSADWQRDFAVIRQIACQSNCLAVGETGFDRIWGPEVELQKAVFEAHTRLAYELKIPLILHLVKGHDLLLEYLKNEVRVPSIIWHGFNLKPHLAEQVLEFPVYFSFGKAINLPESNAVQWLKRCPLDRIFLETDDSQLAISSIFKSASLILDRPEQDIDFLLRENWNRISSRKIE